MFLIDFFSILTFEMSSLISFLFGFLEMFLIDCSIWLLGDPWGTCCQEDPSFEKAIYLSIWIVSKCSESISSPFGFLEVVVIDSLILGFWKFVLIDFFSLHLLKCS